MILYDGAPLPETDPYDEALQELDRLDLERRRAEHSLHLAQSRYEAAWYEVLRLEEQNARRGN